MLRKLFVYSICFAFGLSVLLILSGSRYVENNYPRALEYHRTFKALLTNADDGAEDVGKILEITQKVIKNDLLNYNFTYSGANNIDSLIPESGGNPLRSVIVSTWRSGSTFLGEVLNSMPGNFYHYEPLLSYGDVQLRGATVAEPAINSLEQMLKCNFTGMYNYFEFGKNHQYQFTHNTRLWDHCKYKKELCFDSEFTSRFCRLFPFQSMKVVRVRLHLMQKLLQQKEMKVKVLLLIRDPRAVMQSRLHREFCLSAPDCNNPELLCADMISDYVAAARLTKLYPNQLMVIRYEELAQNPKDKSYEIVKFLGLSPNEYLQEFLETHTNMDIPGVSSTFRVSKDVPFRWKKLLNYDFVDDIQIACKEAMDLWGYQMAYNETHMKSENFNPVLPYKLRPLNDQSP